jgi:hypothetical protein
MLACYPDGTLWVAYMDERELTVGQGRTAGGAVKALFIARRTRSELEKSYNTSGRVCLIQIPE